MKRTKITRNFIAKMARVSPATVSYVLNNILDARIGKKTKEKVLRISKKYNYYPNLFARSLVTKRTFNIGFINTLPLVSFLSDPFQSSIFAGIESEIEKNDYSLLFSLLKPTGEINASSKKMICGHIVDGIVLYGKVEQELIDFLNKNNVKFVLVDYYLEGYNTNSILPENINGSYEITKYLIQKNIKKIYCINGNTKHPSYIERPEGYKKAMQEANLPIHILKTDSNLYSTYEFIKTLIIKNDLPEAFFATGDPMAIGIIRCLMDNGIRVPEQIKVVGFDNIVHLTWEKIKLTTMNVPKIEMGKTAVQLLLKLINSDKDIEPSTIRLPTTFVPGDTA